MSLLANADGTRRVNHASFRSFRHPQTMSNPSSIRRTIAGRSAGSFCRSPSDVAMSRPRASRMPAANAAVYRHVGYVGSAGAVNHYGYTRMTPYGVKHVGYTRVWRW